MILYHIGSKQTSNFLPVREASHERKSHPENRGPKNPSSSTIKIFRLIKKRIHPPSGIGSSEFGIKKEVTNPKSEFR